MDAAQAVRRSLEAYLRHRPAAARARNASRQRCGPDGGSIRAGPAAVLTLLDTLAALRFYEAATLGCVSVAPAYPPLLRRSHGLASHVERRHLHRRFAASSATMRGQQDRLRAVRGARVQACMQPCSGPRDPGASRIDDIPPTAVLEDGLTLYLARCAVADVVVQRMPVVGHLLRAVPSQGGREK